MDNSRTSKIRKALYNARTSKGMSADTLAKLVGVSKTTIYRYEKGEIEKMPMQTLSKLSNVLGISPAFIAGLDDNPSLIDYVKGCENRSSNTVMVPIIGTIACGDPITAEENIEGYLEEPEDYDITFEDPSIFMQQFSIPNNFFLVYTNCKYVKYLLRRK